MTDNFQPIPHFYLDRVLAEIYLKIFKDIIGLAFCFTSGINTMYPLAFGLASRGIMRSIHLYFYLRASRKYKRENLAIDRVVKEKSKAAPQVKTIETNAITEIQSQLLSTRKNLINSKNK